MQEGESRGSMDKVLKFTFIKDPLYRRIAANGLWGGISPTGELKFDLFEDVSEFPQTTIVTLTDGEVKSEVNIPDENGTININRILHIGVSLPISVVPDIITWLQQKVEEYNDKQKTE